MTELEAAFDAARDAHTSAFYDARDAHDAVMAADARAIDAREAHRLAAVRLTDVSIAYSLAIKAVREERDARDSD